MALLRNDKVDSQHDSHLLAAALVAGRLVDEYDMNWAKRECVRRDMPLAEVLVELELVTPQAIQSCIESLRRIGRVKFEA